MRMHSFDLMKDLLGEATGSNNDLQKAMANDEGLGMIVILREMVSNISDMITKRLKPAEVA